MRTTEVEYGVLKNGKTYITRYGPSIIVEQAVFTYTPIKKMQFKKTCIF